MKSNKPCAWCGKEYYDKAHVPTKFLIPVGERDRNWPVLPSCKSPSIPKDDFEQQFLEFMKISEPRKELVHLFSEMVREKWKTKYAYINNRQNEIMVGIGYGFYVPLAIEEWVRCIVRPLNLYFCVDTATI